MTGVADGRSVDRANFNQAWSNLNFHLGAGTVQNGVALSNKAARPNGHLPPSAWTLPIKPGALASYTEIVGLGTLTPDLDAKINPSAGVGGSGTVTVTLTAKANLAAAVGGSGSVAAVLSIRVTIAVTTVSGAGAVAATLTARGGLLATLTGSGALAPSVLGRIARLASTIAGSSSVVATLGGRANLAASLFGEGDLTGGGPFLSGTNLGDIERDLQILLGRAGSNTVVFTVTDSESEPIAGVAVIVEGLTGALVGVGQTDGLGQSTIKLDDGTYNVYLRAAGSGWIFANPYVVVVTGDAAVSLQASNIQQASQSDPSLATVYGWVTDIGLAPQADLKVIAELMTGNVLTLGGTVLGNPIQVFTDIDGYFELQLPVGGTMIPGDAIYRVTIEAANNRMGWQRPFRASRLVAGSSYHLGAIV